MPKQSNMKDGVSIIMPTFQRLKDLPRALGSLMAQTGVNLPVEVIVADNDPKASAKDLIAEYAKTAAFPITYLHVPIPGVSNARNAAYALAKGRYIAWLDDDQEAAPNWLAELLKAANEYDAGLVFCPSPPRMDVSTPLDDQYVKFFDRKAPKADGVITHFYGCGNSLMDLQKVKIPSPVFDPIANESGGEDDMLFSYMQKHGAVTAWTSLTYVYEHVPAKRATPEYVRKRSFAWGQGPTEMAYDNDDYVGILKWMTIGTAQMAVYGPIALLHKTLGRQNYTHWLSKTYQGAGKVFWLRGLRPKLYGQVCVEDKAVVDARRANRPAQS